MISTRNLAISMFCTMLLAPLIWAQDAQPSEASVILQRPPVTEEVALQALRSPSLSLLAGPVWAPLISARDLSRYREFQLGMDLFAVAKRARTNPSAAKVVHQRPAVIQELEWRYPGSLPEADPVKEILFSFYNGELCRMVVSYDPYKTEGLTVEDMIETISARYGTATRPAAEITFRYNESQKVLARWEDSQYSFNLVRSSYGLTFAMVVFSKRLDALAQAAIAEAIRLDKQEAPQREIERQKKQDEEMRVVHEKARLVNKPSFRP